MWKPWGYILKNAADGKHPDRDRTFESYAEDSDEEEASENPGAET